MPSSFKINKRLVINGSLIERWFYFLKIIEDGQTMNLLMSNHKVGSKVHWAQNEQPTKLSINRFFEKTNEKLRQATLASMYLYLK